MSKNNLPTSGVRWGISMEVDNEVKLGVVLGYASMMGAENIAWQPLRDPVKIKTRKPYAKNVKRAKPGTTFMVLQAKLPARFSREEAVKALETSGISKKAAEQAVVRWTKTKIVTRTGPARFQRNDVQLKSAVERLIKQGRVAA